MELVFLKNYYKLNSDVSIGGKKYKKDDELQVAMNCGVLYVMDEEIKLFKLESDVGNTLGKVITKQTI